MKAKKKKKGGSGGRGGCQRWKMYVANVMLHHGAEVKKGGRVPERGAADVGAL